jgi:alkanesulfonate monooxygenase SsuD/methylene tetrahydromethanopterin reductase-like flavin-dependent oxidoreductase (luciferase family)
MRLGMFMMPVHPPGRSMSETLAEDTAKSVLADKLGYDELWMGEHFSATTEPFPSPLMFLAGLVPQTRNLTFGTAVINLPNHHPAIVAAECAQFDHMSGGRFLMGVGSGGLASDFELFNIDPAARQRQFMESIEMILRIWAQDPPYDIQGEFWNVQIKKAIMPELGVGFMPKPLQKPHPPIHISISSPDSASAKLAGSKGWGIISGPVAPRYAVANHWRAYSEARREAGCRARSEDWRVSRLMIVAPTDAEAEERVHGERASNRYYCGYMQRALAAAKRLWMIKPQPEMSDDECTPEAIMKECVIHGSPRTVLDRLVALRERVGPFGTLLQIGLDWGGPNEAWEREGMHLLAQDVMPHFRQHVAAQVTPEAAE